MTAVTPPLENTRFSLFLDFTVLRPPTMSTGGLFITHFQMELLRLLLGIPEDVDAVANVI